MLRLRLALVLAATVLLGATAPVGAIPFGANLNLPANVAFDCTALPLPNAFGTGFVLVPVPNGAQTCTWMAAGTAQQPDAGNFLAPVAGTVTQVSVRVGPVTGPMQVIVLRSFRDFFSTYDPVCCTEVARTPVFVPAPNAVTTIQTALPVRKDTVPDPNTRLVTFDALALSVLAPGVPVPAFDSGRHNPADFGAPMALAFHPAIAPGQQAVGTGSGVGGFQVLLAADVTPSATGLGPGGGGTAPAAIRLVQPAVTVRDGRAPVLITCSLAAGRCVGLLRLQSRAGGGGATAARRATRTVTYGSARFSVRHGRRATVSVTLTRAGRALLRDHARRRVWVNATVGGRAVPALRLTLKRPRTR
ncbi:MAG TPA: hypothetical protein VFS37_05855 [Conexibacter sp.]|nr:hypothetical protein [Conexibacter sp.]